MVSAHTNPNDGPGRIFLTTEFLTAPLFALLVGAGVQLSAARDPSWPRFMGAQLLRALALGLLSVVLTQLYGSVVVVLAALAALTVLCSLVVKAPSWVIASLIPVAIALTPLLAHAATRVPIIADASPSVEAQLLLWSSQGPYHFPAFVAYGGAGMLIARYVRAHQPMQRAGALLACGVLLLGAMLSFLIIPNVQGYGVHAYEGSLLETLGNLSGVCGILAILLGLEAAGAINDSPLSRYYRRLTAPLRSLGRASLSMYALHIVLLRLWVTLTHRSDNAWIVTIGSLLLMSAATWAWQTFFASRASASTIMRPHRRRLNDGPLEGIFALLPR